MPHQLVHVITPGDHFSPRTGSAVPTVVDGLSAAGAGGDVVLVARGTYPDRYASARSVEYPMRRPGSRDRHLDAVSALVGLPRRRARASYRAALGPQHDLPSAVMLAHNAVQAVPEVDTRRHQVVLYAHNELFRSYGRAELRRTLGKSVGTIAVSSTLAERLRDRLPPGLGRVAVVRNGVDTEVFFPDPEWRRGDRLQVMFVGRTVPEKGPDVLARAVRRLRRTDVEVTFVGSAGFDPSAAPTSFERELRHELDPLGPRAHVLPFQDRHTLPRLLRGADVVVVPSVWAEPSGLTVLEGMASGAALVASAVGGIPEQVGDAGVLVPPGDERALAEVIEHLSDDERALRTARESARTHALDHTWHRARAELDEAIADLL
ncbi:glycosyltransferase family 4 protein [Cellulosimicrobium cellulans]|uniref:glycosyltransferase family 4 protein n=1 Tax=Cellulosimicrobium cellulans TaxID=1710 RepID=UPI0035D7EA1B